MKNNNNKSPVASPLATATSSTPAALSSNGTISKKYRANPSNAQEVTAIHVSTIPLAGQFFDGEVDRVKSLNLYHIFIILCTDFFLVFQNTLSLRFLFGKNQLNAPPAIIYSLAALCFIATSMQVVLARGFKIVMAPIHLTLAQKIFLENIEKQLAKLKENDKLLVLVSHEEHRAMQQALFPYLHRSSKNTDLHYAFQILARKYTISFDVLYCDLSDYPKIQKKLDHYTKVLAYSPEYYSYLFSTNDTENSKTSIILSALPSPSVLRWINGSVYADYIGKSREEILALLIHLIKATPNFFLLSALPFVASTLQGISSLNDMVNAFGAHDINGLSRLEIIIPGLMIGLSRSIMTYATKVDPAHNRASKLSRNLSLCTWWNHHPKNPAYNRKFIDDLSTFLSCDFDISLHKRYLLFLHYVAPVCYILFGLFAALGTIAFYAGLGLFFSTAGLFYVIAFCQNVHGEATTEASNDKNAYIVGIISIFLCVATALLNGFYNQGWEAAKNFMRYARHSQKATHELIANSNPTSQWKTPDIITDIFQKNTKTQNSILFLTLVDSFAASVTAYNGSTKILVALNLPDSILSYIAGLMAISIFISQTCFSFELYHRDIEIGGNLWGKMWDVWMPTCCKGNNTNSVTYPYTDATYAYSQKNVMFPPIPVSDSTPTLAVSSGSTSPSESPVPAPRKEFPTIERYVISSTSSS